MSLKKIKFLCLIFILSILFMFASGTKVQALTINNITQTGEINCVYSDCISSNSKTSKHPELPISQNTLVPIEKPLNNLPVWFTPLSYILVGTGITGLITSALVFRNKMLNQQSNIQKRIEILEDIATK